MREDLWELLILVFGLLVGISTIAVPIVRWFYGS